MLTTMVSRLAEEASILSVWFALKSYVRLPMINWMQRRSGCCGQMLGILYIDNKGNGAANILLRMVVVV